MRLKRAGFLTKIVVLALLIYMATSLLELRGQIQTAQVQRDTLAQQVADQRLKNQELEDAIENSDDPETLERVAREKGYVKQDEVLYLRRGQLSDPPGLRGKPSAGGEREIHKEDISVSYGVWCWVHFGRKGNGDHEVRGLCGSAGGEDPVWSISRRSRIPMSTRCRIT